tara:strand:- start:2070 stop:2531 length:462 start_codon:yes stop_codon:yes gene_type:complete
MKKFLIILILFISNCSTNKVIKNHGVSSLEKKHTKLILNKTNKNDIINILGPPSTKSTFNNDVWIYIERKRVNRSAFALGNTKINKNNVLVLEINEMGLLAKKDFLDINKLNDNNFVDEITSNSYSKKSFIYSFLTSVRQKINDPFQNRKKRR